MARRYGATRGFPDDPARGILIAVLNFPGVVPRLRE
jgi:hypothetical protein